MVQVSTPATIQAGLQVYLFTSCPHRNIFCSQVCIMDVSSPKRRQCRHYSAGLDTAQGLAFRALPSGNLYSLGTLACGLFAHHSSWPGHVSSMSPLLLSPFTRSPCRCRAARAMTAHTLATFAKKVSVWPVPHSLHTALSNSSSQERLRMVSCFL